MDHVKVGSAYLIYININVLEDGRDFFEKAMKEADHSAEVYVSLDGVAKEFTLKQFAESLGFKEA